MLHYQPPKHSLNGLIEVTGHFADTENREHFYRAATLLAMQSAVIPIAIPSVCLSVCHPDE